jgi:murein DD-endopeptidase MepM/ murein hydrolase activator NlpD
MGMTKSGGPRVLFALPVILAIAGCTGKQSADRAAVEIKGSDPSAAAASAPAPAQPMTDASGIVSYDSYQAAVARSGDTVASVADRIGLSASELGAYNGLSPNHPLRPGDELVLPQRPGGYGGAIAPQTAASGIQATAPGGTTIESTPLDGTAAASAPEAPAAAWSPDIAAAAIDRATKFDDQDNLAAPPSAAEPLPPAPVEPEALESPRLDQYQTPNPQPQPRPVETVTTPQEQSAEPEPAVPQPAAPQVAAASPAPASELRLIHPVQGPIVVGFQQGAGRARNDGIDFASPAGSPVVAAANGEVALVSQSLGGLGTIVLVRHPGDYLTVYGRIDRVSVVKGDLVSRGQKIGVVSPATEPRMHFEVRQGAESLDPERFF